MPAVPIRGSLLIQPLSGYPDPYVAARLIPRLSRMRQPDAAAGAAADSWALLRQAVTWSFRQLAQPRRQQLERLYLFFELPLLMTAIRFTVAGDRRRASNVLAGSLWDSTLQRLVTQAPDVTALEKRLADRLVAAGWTLPAPAGACHALQRLEYRLHQGLLAQMRDDSPPQQLAEFFMAAHDLFNLASCRSPSHPPPSELIPGGRLPDAAFQNRERLARAIVTHYGRARVPGTDPEQYLRHAYAATLLRRARSGDLLTRLIAYLWGHLVHIDVSVRGTSLHGRSG